MRNSLINLIMRFHVFTVKNNISTFITHCVCINFFFCACKRRETINIFMSFVKRERKEKCGKKSIMKYLLTTIIGRREHCDAFTIVSNLVSHVFYFV